MTNADWLNAHPEITAGTMAAEAVAWYAHTHSKADIETASQLGILTAWLAAEHREPDTKREVTLVTTLVFTHVLHDAEADEVLRCGTAQRVADALLQHVRKGLRVTARPYMHPDNVSIERVQVFGLEKESRNTEGGSDGSDGAIGAEAGA